MDSYARQILLAFLDADLETVPDEGSQRLPLRSLWSSYARAVKDATRRWPVLARWEPTTEWLPSVKHPGMPWAILVGEPAPQYPFTVAEMTATMLRYFRERKGLGQFARLPKVSGRLGKDFSLSQLRRDH